MQKRERIKRLLRTNDVVEITGFHRQSLWRKVRDKTFPAPLKLGTTNVWPEEVVQKWRDDVIAGAIK